MQQTAAAPPPPGGPPNRDAGRAMMANMRMRRSSMPIQAMSSRDLLGAADAGDVANPFEDPMALALLSRGGAPMALKKPGATPESNPDEPTGPVTDQPDVTLRRESTIFAVEQSRQDHEYMGLIAGLQQNVMSLTANNQREKAINEHLKKQVAAVTAELIKAKELYEDERAKNEKITAMRKQKGGDFGGYLPDINSPAAAAAAAAALQQQAQMEVSYQRKILSLENRYKDLAENNKRLLRKIEHLEKTEADAGALINSLRQDNIRLATEVDSLSSTVTSQSSLIIGLRSTLQKLNQEEHQIGTLMKKFDRSQIDLEATKVREKMLKEEFEKMKMVMSKEKESLMNKILEFQHRLQASNRSSDDVESLLDRIQNLENDKRVVIDEMMLLREEVMKAETRMHEQEQMTNRLLQENEMLQTDKRSLHVKLSTLESELNDCNERETALHSKMQNDIETNYGELRQKEEETRRLMLQIVDLQALIDGLERTTAKQQSELQNFRQLQLSHDETVQALQLARQKAATHEALTLVNEEKKAVEDKLNAEREAWSKERLQLVAEKDEVLARTTALNDQLSRLQEMCDMLRDRPVEQVIVENIVPSSDANDRLTMENDLMSLRAEYEDVRTSLENIEKEYNKLVTKKYKTESFQSQVRLLQNENNELSNQLESLLRDQENDRIQLQARAIEILELKGRVMDPGVIEMLRKTQESLERTVGTLVEAETASESTFTCLQCMRLFVDPMTLTPCGHTYCSSCLNGFGNVTNPSSILCKECVSAENQGTESVFANQALADLTARFIYRQQSLSTLTTMCLSLRNSFATRTNV